MSREKERNHAVVPSGGHYSAPAVLPERSVSVWPNRPPPAEVNWQPPVPATWFGRLDAQAHTKNFTAAAELAQAGTRFFQASQSLEQARQELEHTHARRALLPLVVAHERMVLQTALAKALGDFEAVQTDLAGQRARRTHQQWLADDDFHIQTLRREAERRELEARIAMAGAQASFAAQIGQRRGEAGLHQARGQAFRAQVGAEHEQGQRDDARDRRRAPVGSHNGMSEVLGQAYATEREVHVTHAEADRRAQAIRDHAAAQGRDLTDDELEEMDMLEDAAAAAEGSIRRGEASDL